VRKNDLVFIQTLQSKLVNFRVTPNAYSQNKNNNFFPLDPVNHAIIIENLQLPVLLQRPEQRLACLFRLMGQQFDTLLFDFFFRITAG